MANKEASSSPRSAGYRRLHSFLCVIATLILLWCTTGTAVGRDCIARNTITDGLLSSRLSDASIPFNGTVAEFIRKNFVSDDLVTQEDVAEAVDIVNIPRFVAKKIEAQRNVLLGNSDEAVHITADDIVELLEDNEDALYDKCLLVIEDSDKDEIRSSAGTGLKVLNGINDVLYGNGFMRAVTRFRMNGWSYVVYLVLAVLLLFRWRKIRSDSGADPEIAFRSMGRTIMIPSCIAFVLLVVSKVMSMFAADGKVGMLEFAKAVRGTLWIIVIMEIAVGFYLTSIAKYRMSEAFKEASARKKAAAPTHRAADRRRGRMETVSVPAAPKNRFCISCGKEIQTGAAFCIYCGAKQTADAPKPPAPDTPAAPEVTEQPVTPEVSAVSEVPAAPESENKE